MTDFLATLALRGAGLPPADGRGTLAPRPRARFEPEPAGAGDAALLERADEVPAPAAHPEPRPAMPEPVAAPGEPPATAAVAPPPHDGTRQPAPAPAVVAPPVARRDAVSPSPDARPSHTSGRPDEASLPARTAAPALHPTTVRHDTPPRSPSAERVTPPVAAAKPVSDDGDPSPAAVVPRPPAIPLRAASPISVRLPEAPEARPAVTVSIGRIDVEVAAPLPPAAPVQRPAPERTRGFEHYARARRGRPRS